MCEKSKLISMCNWHDFLINVKDIFPKCHWPTNRTRLASSVIDRSAIAWSVVRRPENVGDNEGRDGGVAHLDPSCAWASWALSSCCAKVPGCCCRRCCCAAATRWPVRSCRDGDDDDDDGGADDDGGDTARCWVAAAVARSRRNCRRGCSRDRGGCFCCPWPRTLRTPP